MEGNARVINREFWRARRGVWPPGIFLIKVFYCTSNLNRVAKEVAAAGSI